MPNPKGAEVIADHDALILRLSRQKINKIHTTVESVVSNFSIFIALLILLLAKSSVNPLFYHLLSGLAWTKLQTLSGPLTELNSGKQSALVPMEN